MAIRRRQIAIPPKEDEGFFVSMTDMMVGMLFLFILMLMFFALKFDEAAIQTTRTVNELLSTEDSRRSILAEIQRALAERGITVTVDADNGILRLPENILFERNRADLSDRGRDAVTILGQVLGDVLPCYTTIPGQPRASRCPETPHRVEAIFIEGHTDSDGDDALNWTLSVRRALDTYQSMVSANPPLAALRNTREQAVLSVSGYGKQRPVRPNDSDDNKRLNRRIDLRFIMTTPRASQLEGMETQIR